MFDLLSDADFSGVSFEDEVEDPQAILMAQQAEDREFWRLLKDDREKIKEIDASGELAGGVRNMPDGGTIFVRAKKEGEGRWRLSKDKENFQKVYLLNYTPASVTCVERDAYERDHDFFLTVALSGCRFTLTDKHVLHIAADAGKRSGLSDSATSAERDEAERAKLNVVPGRKRSVSVNSRQGSILYHPKPAAALAHTAQREAVAAMNGKVINLEEMLRLAQEVADYVGKNLSSPETVESAAVKLKESINNLKEEAAAKAAVELICATFKNALHGDLQRVNTMVRGAFVVGIKGDAEWKYHALVNGNWADILLG